MNSSHEFMKSLSDCQLKSGAGAPGDPAAKSDQWVAKTFHHLDAQLDHRQHQSYCRSGRFRSNIVKVGGKSFVSTLCVVFWKGGANTSNSGKARASYWSLEFKSKSGQRGPIWPTWSAWSNRPIKPTKTKLHIHPGLVRPLYDSRATFFTAVGFLHLSKANFS